MRDHEVVPTTSSRLLALLSLLQSRRDWTGQELADRLEVTTRTIRRDVDRLRELGYRVGSVHGPAGGYRLEAGADLPPMLFDDEQAVALAISLRIGATAGAGMEDAALRALTTVRQVMPARLRRRVDVSTVTSIPPPGDDAAMDGGVLTTLAAVTHAREVLRFDYGPERRSVPPRRAEPHHVVTWRGRWYLVAWDLDRSDWRIFRADRITPRVPTGPRFVPRELPGGDVAEYVVGRFRGADGTSSSWPCHGHVIVDLPLAEVLPYVGDGVAEPVDERRTRLSLGSWSWTGLAAAFLRFDAALSVVGPPELADAMRTLADRARLAVSR